MNLNKQARAQLLNDVLIDQFGDEVKAKQDKLNLAIESEVKRLDNGASKKLLSLHNSLGNDFVSISARQYASCRDLFSRHDIRIKVTNTFNGSNVFRISSSAPIKNSIVCQFDCVVDKTPEIQAAYDENIELFKNINNIKDSLCNVLMSVRTVKKLSEITKVFDPFIKTEKKTEILPVSDLCKINELKTPKTPN